MKKTTLLFSIALVALLSSPLTYGQNIGINATGATPNTSAMLDVDATNKGVLIPRVALTAANVAGPVATPATSLLVYNTATAGTAPNNVTPGFYYWNGARWEKISNDQDAWKITGNSNATSGIHFLGTTNAQALDFRTNNAIRFRIANGNQVHAMADGTAAEPFYSWGANTGMGLYKSGANILGFSTSGAERMRLMGTGELAINMTAPFSLGGQNAKLSINGAASSAIVGSTNSNAIPTLQMQQYGQNSAIIGVVDNTSSNSYAAFIQTNGINSGGVGSLSSATGNSTTDAYYGSVSGANGFGAFLVNKHLTGTGIGASGNNLPVSYLVAGSGGAFSGKTTGVYGKATPGSTIDSQGGYFVDSVGPSSVVVVRVAAYNSSTQYKIIGTGAVSTIVKDVANQEKIMFAPEAPEVLLQDYGVANLVNGETYVSIDPIFANNIFVDAQHEMKVFIQLEGDCNGVYVTDKTVDGFRVKELAGGTSNVKFSYQIVANRKDDYKDGQLVSKYQDLRFPTAPDNKSTRSKVHQVQNSEVREIKQ